MSSGKLEKIRLMLISCGLIEFAMVSLFNLSSISNLFLLPLTYAFSMLLMKKCYANNMGLALVIIEVVKVCRYLVLPIMISRERLFSGIDLAHKYSVSIAQQYNEAAVLLMSYELICVSLVMFFFASKSKMAHSVKKRNNGKATKRRNNGKVTFMWYFLIVFGLFIVVTEPSLRTRLFNFELSFLNEAGFNRDSNVKISGVSRVFFLLGIVTSFAFLENLINKMSISAKSKLLFQIIVCILLVSCLWTTEGGSVSRWNMVIGVLLSIYILIFYFPSSRKKIIIGGLSGVLFVVIIGSLLKTLSFGLDSYTVSDSTKMYFSSQYFDEYFGGVRSVSNCIIIAKKYGNLNVIDGVFTDWFYSFPFFIKIVGLSNLPVATHYYHIVSGHYDLIMPTITMGLLRFGWILAPLYSCLAVFFALHFGRKLRQEQNILVKLFYIYIVFWFSLFMAISPNVIDSNIWAPFIGIWLLKFEKKYFYTKVILR